MRGGIGATGTARPPVRTDSLVSPPQISDPVAMNTSAPRDMRASLGRNLTHGMLDLLGRAIVTGSYDGKRFPTEAELAAQLGVSRSVTREAVKMLTAKGLLSAKPRQGTIVEPEASWNLFDPHVLSWLLDRQWSPGLLRQFNQLRIGIEPTAAMFAADLSGDDERCAIRRSFDRMIAADRGQDDPLDADIAFHVSILHATRNAFYAQFEDVIATALRTSIRFTNRFAGRSADLDTHCCVLQAIERRDGPAAYGAMRTIISEVLDLLENSTAQDHQGETP